MGRLKTPKYKKILVKGAFGERKTEEKPTEERKRQRKAEENKGKGKKGEGDRGKISSKRKKEEKYKKISIKDKY